LSAALFALGGALIGVLGTVLTDLARGRRDDRKLWREELRSVCAELAGEVTHLQDLTHALQRSPEDIQLQRAAEDAHSGIRAQLERLRLTSKSVETQKAARWLLHYAYYQWRSIQDGKADFQEAKEGVRTWLPKFYAAAREELGLESSAIYQAPPDGLPIPGSERQTKPRNS
jgi:hypothetical protein